MINLYDWLQAFLSILDPTDEEDESDKRRVDPELQYPFLFGIGLIINFQLFIQFVVP